MDATAADWITAAFTVVLAVFTAALVVVTARYVTQTRNLVTETQKSREESEKGREQSREESRLTREEMRASREESRLARELSVLPKLAIDLRLHGPNFARVQVVNVGPGPALGVDIHIAFEPRAKSQRERNERPWQANIVVSGDGPEFDPPDGDLMGAFAAAYEQVRLTGSMRSVSGEPYDVDEVLDDLAGRWERLQASEQVLEREPIERLTRDLGKPLNKGVKELHRARQALERLAPAPERQPGARPRWTR